MFQNNVVACIKVNGRILRESGDAVTLPFGSEYSVLVKNLNSVRAQVSISVDGKDATDGTKLIIPANSSIELERFIRNGNLKTGNRFKFIERTTGIEEHRGVGSDDGLVRVEAWKERVQQFVDLLVPRYYDDWRPYPRPHPWWPYYGPYYTLGCDTNVTLTSGLVGQNCGTANAAAGLNDEQVRRESVLRSCSFTSASMGNLSKSAAPEQANLMAGLGATQHVPVEKPGITVAGSRSDQQFKHSAGFQLEPQSVVLVLRLRGEAGGRPVAQPVTVQQKPKCETCGKQNKADAQYCSKCGTALVMFA